MISPTHVRRKAAAARLAAEVGVSVEAALEVLARFDGDVLRAEQWLSVAVRGGFPLVSTAEKGSVDDQSEDAVS